MIKNKISILVVDDELDICEMVAETLKDEGYNVIIATNYDMAVDILKNKNMKTRESGMWHEARRQERKIRGLMVDYRKRAERRRDFYERIVSI